MSPSTKHYVPILKWKRGEKVGLEYCQQNVKRALTPLLEVVPPPWDYENECPTKTIDQHLDGIGVSILESWGTERPFFIDAELVEDETMDDGSHSMEFILEDCRSQGVKAVPVTGSERDGDYQDTVLDAVRTDKLGLCFRMVDADFSDMNVRLSGLLTRFGVTPEEVDLVIDLGAFDEHETGSRSLAATALIDNLIHLNSWRTLTLAGSAFPSDLGEVEKNSVGRLKRVEWDVWKAVASKSKRKPSFGDYAISHPHYTEVDPRIMQMSGNVRYTAESCWVIVKGINTKKHGFDQMIGLCKTLMAQPEYCGPKFSWGDLYISDCSKLVIADRKAWKKGNATTGNAETWRRVGTNHHLTFVVFHLAKTTLP